MRRLIRILLFASLTLAVTGCATRILPPSAPDHMITKRASRQQPPRWVLPLGPALVEEMRLLDNNRLLVGLQKDFPSLPNMDYLLVDTKRGDILWRHERKEDATYHLMLASRDLLIFRVSGGKNVSLIAVDAKTGATAWSSDLGSGRVTVAPDEAADRIVAVREEEQRTTITALRLRNGETVWQKELPAGSRIPSPIVEEAVWHFSNGVECLSLKEGATRWARTDVQPAEGGPPPQREGEVLLIFLAGNTLSALHARTGESLWSTTLPAGGRYTNIYPYGGRIYLRGVTKEAGRRFKLYAVDAAARKLLWTYGGAEPSVSNLIESGGRLYFGTATSLTAVDVSSGKELFSSAVSTAGRAYPVHIRKIDKKVIFIGELVVAAYDAATGRQIYRHGMTPVSNEAHLSGLDASIAGMKETVAGISTGSSFGGITAMTYQESQRYQNMANSYHKQYHYYYAKGDYYRSEAAGIQADLNRAQAKNMATISFVSAVADLAVLWVTHLQQAAVETTIRRQELFRSSILSSYGMAETADYVYRPHLQWRNAEDAFVTLSVVHLPDGKRKDTVLSPQYLGYGLWNLVDFEKGVVYHHGIGMDPTGYRYTEPRTLYPYGRVQTIENYLIAAPVDIPR